MRYIVSLTAFIFISFLVSHKALSVLEEDIYGSWILTDVKNSMQQEGYIGIMKLEIEQYHFTFDYGRYKDKGSYSISGDRLKFVSNRTKREKIYEISFQEQMLNFKEHNTQVTLIFSRGSSVPFKINSGDFDERFSSPEKTYALFRKRIQENYIADAVECFVPSKAGSYYKTFSMLGEKFDSFSESLPENIRRRSVTDRYISYWIKRKENNREISYTIVFVRTQKDIYLIYQF